MALWKTNNCEMQKKSGERKNTYYAGGACFAGDEMQKEQK